MLRTPQRGKTRAFSWPGLTPSTSADTGLPPITSLLQAAGHCGFCPSQTWTLDSPLGVGDHTGTRTIVPDSLFTAPPEESDFSPLCGPTSMCPGLTQ